MASKDYLKLCNEAQKKKLKLAKKQQQDIKNIYQDMYLKVSKKLNKVNPESLTERYLEELKKELEKEIRITNNNVGKVIKNNIEESSKLANNVELDFFMQLNEKYSLNMKDTFAGMFSKIPKNAMDEILFGDAYKDRKGLSERIWQHTKKFDKDIDYIIAQGIAEKKGTYEIAKDLEKYVNPNEAKDWNWNKAYPKSNKVIDYNAQRLARTSVNHAFQQAQKRSCSKNPFVEGIRWLSAEIHDRTCQQCKDRHNTVYTVKDVPLDHANGLCTTIPEIPMSLEDIGGELRDWVDGKDNPKLDEWYSKYGEKFADSKSNNKDNKGNNKEYNKLSVAKETKKIKKIKFENNKDAANYLKNKYGFEKVSFGTKADIDVVNSLVNNSKKVYDKYPQLNGFVRNFEIGKMSKAYAYFKYGLNKDGNILTLKTSSDLMGTVKDAMTRYERDISKGFHPKGTTWNDIIVHEYGHVIECFLTAKKHGLTDIKHDTISREDMKKIYYSKSSNTIATEIREEAFKALNIKEMESKSQIISDLSRYALQSSAETLAEAFADAMANGKNAQPISKEILKIIDREMNK